MTMGRYDGMDENKGSAWAVCTARGCEEPRADVCIKLDHNTMITLITTQWSHYSHPSDDFDHNSKLINSIVTLHIQFDQDCNQMTTSWWSTCCSHHPSLACTSRSNLGWPYLTQVLGAASHLDKHLAHYRYLCTWQPCCCCPVTCIALNGVWLANPLSNHFFQILRFVFFPSRFDNAKITFSFTSFSDLSQKHAVRLLACASFNCLVPVRFS